MIDQIESNLSSRSTLSFSPHQSSQKKSYKRLSDRYLPLRNNLFTSLKQLIIDNVQKQSKNLSNIRVKNNKTSLIDLYQTEILGHKQNNKEKAINSFTNFNQFKYIDQCKGDSLDLSDKGIFSLSSYKINKCKRKKCKKYNKILDAPDLVDDFYLNLLDWSSDIVSVALKNTVCLWSSRLFRTIKLTELEQSQLVACVSGCQYTNQLCIGTQKGKIQLWDCNKGCIIRTFQGHSKRVGSISWNDENIFASGSNDHKILIRDKRASDQFEKKMKHHKDQICGLKFSFDKQQLISGGNDNRVNIWTLHSQSPVSSIFKHKSAVRALAWSPNQHGLFASGGGLADRTIRFWNSLTGQQVKCVATQSQVCNLIFSKNTNQLISTHGYNFNQIKIWKLPNLQIIQQIIGHTERVLYLAMNSQGTTIATGAGLGDQTIRFWDIFGQKQKIPCQYQSKLSASSMALR